MTLHLVRHARTDADAGLVVGHHDAGLSEEGRAAANRLAESWAGPPPARLVASDLRRALDSAAPFAARWGLAVEPEPRLREVHFGAWEGRTWNAVQAEDEPALNGWMADWVNVAPPGGESFVQLVSRAAAWLAEVEAAPGPLLAVAHAGSIRALIVAALRLPPDRAFSFTINLAHVVRLDRGMGGWTLTFSNAPSFPAS
ncbi:MAG TPA: histidine phosphatase family protein [Longimicrobium sp.]|jgi:broad specificity phosphatase PhoE|uniref:histidine phosphatase family protein n=1 Tax=Longimicrobium sp. TaxID=2029185 RepID=UPI002EDB648C